MPLPLTAWPLEPGPARLGAGCPDGCKSGKSCIQVSTSKHCRNDDGLHSPVAAEKGLRLAGLVGDPDPRGAKGTQLEGLARLGLERVLHAVAGRHDALHLLV